MFFVPCGIPHNSDPRDCSVRLDDDEDHDDLVPAPTTAVLPKPPRLVPQVDPSADSLEVGLVDFPRVVIT